MKKTHIVRTFAAGFLAALLLAGVVPSAAAAVAGKSITVYPGVSIYIDDQKLNPKDASGKAVEVFNYNGTVYLPVRAISEALGKPVQWNSSTRSVYVGRHSAAASSSVWGQQDSTGLHLMASVDGISTADADKNVSGLERFGSAPSVVAAAAAKKITVYPGVSIYIDDQKLNPKDASGKAVEVFNYNGTVYLPVRAISEALGKPVQWDGGTRSVYVGKHSAVPNFVGNWQGQDVTGVYNMTITYKDGEYTVFAKRNSSDTAWREWVFDGSLRQDGTLYCTGGFADLYVREDGSVAGPYIGGLAAILSFDSSGRLHCKMGYIASEVLGEIILTRK